MVPRGASVAGCDMAKVKVERKKPMKLAYVEHVGPYGSIPFDRYIEQLYGWAKAQKVRPGFHPLGIFHDSPRETPPERCRSDIAIPIYGDAAPAGTVKVKDLPAMDVATLSFKGTSSEYQGAYDALGAWIAEHGYEWAGPSMEVYSKKPETVGGKTIMYAKIEAPVRKR